MTIPPTVTTTLQDAATPAHGVTRERLETEVRAQRVATQRLAEAHPDEFNAYFVQALAEEPVATDTP